MLGSTWLEYKHKVSSEHTMDSSQYAPETSGLRRLAPSRAPDDSTPRTLAARFVELTSPRRASIAIRSTQIGYGQYLSAIVLTCVYSYSTSSPVFRPRQDLLVIF